MELFEQGLQQVQVLLNLRCGGLHLARHGRPLPRLIHLELDIRLDVRGRNAKDVEVELHHGVVRGVVDNEDATLRGCGVAIGFDGLDETVEERWQGRGVGVRLLECESVNTNLKYWFTYPPCDRFRRILDEDTVGNETGDAHRQDS